MTSLSEFQIHNSRFFEYRDQIEIMYYRHCYYSMCNNSAGSFHYLDPICPRLPGSAGICQATVSYTVSLVVRPLCLPQSCNPHCVRCIATHMLWLGRCIIVHFRLSSHTSGCGPPFETRHYRSPEGSWRIVSHAYAFTDTGKKVPDDCVFGFQCSKGFFFPINIEMIYPLTCRPRERAKVK